MMSPLTLADLSSSTLRPVICPLTVPSTRIVSPEIDPLTTASVPMRYHVTIDNTSELDIAIRFDIARDANILTEDRRRHRLFHIIGGRFPLTL